MADVSILDIAGSQWNFKDENARNKILALERKFSALSTYSTSEEINTGKTWIDGKTIYRRTFDLTLSSDNQHAVILPSGVTVVNYFASGVRKDNVKIGFPYLIPQDGTASAAFIMRENEYYFRAGYAFVSSHCPMSAKLTVEYTKSS